MVEGRAMCTVAAKQLRSEDRVVSGRPTAGAPGSSDSAVPQARRARGRHWGCPSAVSCQTYPIGVNRRLTKLGFDVAVCQTEPSRSRTQTNNRACDDTIVHINQFALVQRE